MHLSDREVFPLWTPPVPGALDSTPGDTPTLQVFLPEAGHATGASVIVCPGGGYVMLADHEGQPVAEWLARNGITAFVLRYRLGPRYRYPVQLGDAQRALRYVRAHAEEWQLDRQRIGILGFSAGGHLASLTAVYFDPGHPQADDTVERYSSHPDVQILIYPVISMTDIYRGPVDNVLGNEPHPPATLLKEMSSDQQVKAATPPAFLVHSTEDQVVPASHSDKYAASLEAANIPHQYIRGAFGAHGFGLQDSWTPQCMAWLHEMGW